MRAVSASGTTVTGFSGVIAVSVSDGKAPLDGLVLELAAADQGQVTVPDVAFFPTLGTLSITARTLVLAPGDAEVSGSLQVEVGLAAPVIFPSLPPTIAAGGELTLQGLSYVGRQVELVIDGGLVATEVAGPGGAFTMSARLLPGTHEVLVRSIDPATGLLVTSRTFVVVQTAPPASGLEATPAEVTIAVGQTQPLTLRERFADRTTRDVTALSTYGTSDPLVATVSPAGRVTATGVGTATITAGYGTFAVVVPVTVGAPILVESSPSNGEAGVATSRETVLRFSAPVLASSVTDASIQAEYAGAPLAGTLHLSSDRKTVTLFYAQTLPTSARPRLAGDLDPRHLLLREDGLPFARASTVNRLVSRVARKAGVKVHPHALRRAIASHLVERGVSVALVQRYLGHERIASTQLHVEVERATLRRAVETLETAVD